LSFSLKIDETVPSICSIITDISQLALSGFIWGFNI